MPVTAEQIANVKTVTIRARAFSGESVRNHVVRVEGDDVLVWDSVAGHYTRCHCLSKSAIAKAKKLADEDFRILGRKVYHDRSGGHGHHWVRVTADDAFRDFVTEIECEIIDGGKDTCDSYRSCGGEFYRW